MATVETRKDADGYISYRVKVRLKGYPVANATFRRKTDAKRWAAETEAEIRAGRYFKTAEARRHTLSDAIERYISGVLPSLKDKSHRVHHLNWWKKELGHMLLADLHAPVISEAKDRLKKERAVHGRHKNKYRSETTINRYLASLSPVLTSAVREWGWLETNPCQKVKRAKESKGRVRYLNEQERRALLLACENFTYYPELKIIVLIAITTGARRGEILGLKWKDIDLSRNRILIQESKNGEKRSVAIVGPAKTAILEWSKIRPINGEVLVFPSRTKDSTTNSLSINKPWQKVVLEAGLKDFRFHDLRHTAASYLAMNGAGLREIADILGHKTLSMVHRYSHLCDDHKHKTMERMAEGVFGVEA